MNRAWIPAGALASVSVAGLIALGPLTDSLGTTVSFPDSVRVNTGAAAQNRASVPVSVNLRTVGDVKTQAAVVSRGDQATVIAPVTSDTGQVGYRKRVTSAPRVTVTPAKPAVKPEKKAPKRQKSIGTTGETNGDNGLAGGGQGSQGQGETSSTLAP
jgi:hypothetical protein